MTGGSDDAHYVMSYDRIGDVGLMASWGQVGNKLSGPALTSQVYQTYQL